MRIQDDRQVRIVALDNLIAMCEHVSGMCHRWEVLPYKPGAKTVRVQYANPDEWGADHPIEFVCSTFPSGWGEKDNPYVFIEWPTRILYAKDDNEREYMEQVWLSTIHDCPRLWRNPENGTWVTE